MERALYRPLLAVIAATALLAGRSTADDDPLHNKAIKLNHTTGTNAMAARLAELLKDEANTKKLLATAAKMVKDEKPCPLNYNACFILAKAAQLQKDADTALVFYRTCAQEATKVGSATKIVDVYNGMIDLYVATKKLDEAMHACQEFLEIPVADDEIRHQTLQAADSPEVRAHSGQKGQVR